MRDALAGLARVEGGAAGEPARVPAVEQLVIEQMVAGSRLTPDRKKEMPDVNDLQNPPLEPVTNPGAPMRRTSRMVAACLCMAALLGGWTAPLLAAAPPLAGRAASSQPAVSPTPGLEAPLGPAGGAPAAPPSPMNPTFLFLLMGMLVFMIVMSSLSARKERKRREALLADLGRHDRVQTMGGVIGTIVEVKDQEVILKVDESTNTRMTFARSSVQAVLKKGSGSRSEEPEGSRS